MCDLSTLCRRSLTPPYPMLTERQAGPAPYAASAWMGCARPCRCPKVRRTQLEAAQGAARTWAKELQAQHADAERLGEREAQLEAFAAAVREGLDALDFEGSSMFSIATHSPQGISKRPWTRAMRGCWRYRASRTSSSSRARVRRNFSVRSATCGRGTHLSGGETPSLPSLHGHILPRFRLSWGVHGIGASSSTTCRQRRCLPMTGQARSGRPTAE